MIIRGMKLYMYSMDNTRNETVHVRITRGMKLYMYG